MPSLEDPMGQDFIDGALNFNGVFPHQRIEGAGRRPPRPSSIPAAKKFNGVSFINICQMV